MAWFDILGGVAGGLQQGLGQFQQAQQAKQAEARAQQAEARQLELLKIQQAQDVRAQQAAKRQEEQERLEMFKQMLAGEDPLNVSGQTMSILQQKYADLVPTAIAKNTETDTFEVKMPPAQRAALKNAKRQLEDTARYTTLVNTAPEGSLSATEAVAAVRRGGQDASLVVTLVKPSELLAFQKALYPKETLEGLFAQQREAARAAAGLAEANLRVRREGGLTDFQTAQILQKQLEPLQTAVAKARADAALYPTDATAQQALKDSEAKLATKEQQVYAAMSQQPNLAVVASTFQPPSTAGITVTAPDGTKHSFATQVEADRFKQLAGIK